MRAAGDTEPGPIGAMDRPWRERLASGQAIGRSSAILDKLGFAPRAARSGRWHSTARTWCAHCALGSYRER